MAWERIHSCGVSLPHIRSLTLPNLGKTDTLAAGWACSTVCRWAGQRNEPRALAVSCVSAPTSCRSTARGGMTHRGDWPAVQGEHRPWQVEWILRRTSEKCRYGAEGAPHDIDADILCAMIPGRRGSRQAKCAVRGQRHRRAFAGEGIRGITARGVRRVMRRGSVGREHGQIDSDYSSWCPDRRAACRRQS